MLPIAMPSGRWSRRRRRAVPGGAGRAAARSAGACQWRPRATRRGVRPRAVPARPPLPIALIWPRPPSRSATAQEFVPVAEADPQPAGSYGWGDYRSPWLSRGWNRSDPPRCGQAPSRLSGCAPGRARWP